MPITLRGTRTEKNEQEWTRLLWIRQPDCVVPKQFLHVMTAALVKTSYLWPTIRIA